MYYSWVLQGGTVAQWQSARLWCMRSGDRNLTIRYELHFISGLINSLCSPSSEWVPGTLYRAEEGQKAARKGTGHPISSCRGFVYVYVYVYVFLYKAHPLRMGLPFVNPMIVAHMLRNETSSVSRVFLCVLKVNNKLLTVSVS